MPSPLSFAASKKFIIGALVLIICFVLTLLFYQSNVFDQFNQQWVDEKITSQGNQGVLYYFILIALGTAVGLPRQLAAFLGGYAFGTITGLVLATLAATVGCALSYFTARLILSRLILNKFTKQSLAIQRFMNERLFIKTIIIRLMPAGNNFLTNLICGSCRIHAPTFIGASMVGFIPQMSIFALAGSGFVVQEYWKLGLSGVLLVISILLSLKLYREHGAELKTK